jgi:hypothetical protein
MCFRIDFPLSAYVQPIPLLQPLHFHGCIWVKELELPRATRGPPSSYTRAPGMRGGSPAAAGVAAAAFSLTPTFTPTFAGASSADLVLVLVQAVEERAAARRAAEAAAAPRDAAKCALQQQLDQVWPPPPSPTPTFTPTFAGASSPDLVGPVARCGKPCSGLSSGGAGGVLCVGGVGSGVHPYLIHRLQEGARGSEGARGRRCSGPMLGRGWWLAVRSQQSVPQRIRRSARQRCG